MIDRSRQVLVLALFVLLQILMQPLALASSCAMLGSGDEGCVCAHQAGHESESEGSCCSEPGSASAPAERDDCDCYVSPQPDPMTPVEMSDTLVGTAWFSAGPVDLVLPVDVLAGLGQQFARDLVPRVSRSRLVLYQVFRL
jgi:hypothetical protein